MAEADIGLIGMAVMGQNLVLNMADHGFTVAVCNRRTEPLRQMMQRAAGSERIFTPVDLATAGEETTDADLANFLKRLKKPRKVMIMVKAGKPVDAFIERLLALNVLEPGDIIIDGGNSHFPDSIRRTRYLEEKGMRFIGTGVSGGEEGARHGPSLMPGGSPDAWPHVKPIFQAIAAKVEGGSPCCDWVGENGAGHYVKMTHNGIEYGDIQLICEAYHLMGTGLGLPPERLQQVFAEWNRGVLDSYLIQITADILAYRDEDGAPLVEKILDTAGQKGTGKWTGMSALELGQPLTLIGEAVFARCLSALKDERVAAARKLKGPRRKFRGDPEAFIEDVRQGLYASKIVSYAQGFQLLRAAAAEYRWKLNYGGIALMWRGGCIIRSVFLGKIKEAFDKRPKLVNLLLDDYFRKEVAQCQGGWRRVVANAVRLGLPVPAFSSALAYYDGYRSARLPANLLQAQRDYFGAHTYERTDRPRGEFFHTNWTGRGGEVSASTYTV